MTAFAPLLPIESFREIIGYHPFHFWGLSNSTYAPINSACNSVVQQHAWQNSDAGGREDILEAIATAESRLRELLRFSVAPHFVTEILPFPRFYNRGVDRMNNTDPDNRWLSVQLGEGKVVEVGSEQKTLLETVTITYSDTDGDSLNDTFTVTTVATTTETDINRIAVYFSSANRLDTDGTDDRWLIKPVKVTINGNGTVTIRGRSWMLAKPILYEGVANLNPSNGIDPTDATKFITTVDVYIRKAYAAGQLTSDSQAVLTWETPPYPSWAACCVSSSSVYGSNAQDPSSIATAIARCGIRDAEAGLVIPAASTYDSTTQSWGAVNWNIARPPDRVTVRYLSGDALIDGEMNKKWQTIVARLAAAELDNRICACDTANRSLYRWQFDLARTGGANDESYSISPEDLNNPLGTKRGQVYAWKQVQDLVQLVGFLP